MGFEPPLNLIMSAKPLFPNKVTVTVLGVRTVTFFGGDTIQYVTGMGRGRIPERNRSQITEPQRPSWTMACIPGAIGDTGGFQIGD